MKAKTVLAAALAALLALTAARAAVLTPAETKAIAEEGFIYGLPIVMNYAVMYEYAVDRDSGQFKAPFNQIKNEARVFTYEDTAIVTPNSDTPYSFAWLDLRAEPIVLSVPAVEKPRYYAVMLCDGNTFNYGYIGSRATGSDAGDYMVVGPDWKGETPAGIKKVFRSTTQFSVAGYRTQLFNAADMPNVVKVQAGYKVQPLSAYLKQPAPPAAPAINFPKVNKALVKTNFFEYLDFALQFAPPGPEEKAIRAKLATLGIGAGKTFDLKSLAPDIQAAMAAGMKAGAEKVTDSVEHLGTKINGWNVASITGRPRLLQRRLAEACHRSASGHLWQRRSRGHVSADQNPGQRRAARRQQAQLHAHLSRRAISAGECLLVGDHVQRQDAVPDQELDQPLPHQFADVAEHEEEQRWFVDSLHPKGFTGRRQGIQLAARA